VNTKLVLSALSLAAATLIGPGTALAQQCSNTQTQVKAELAQALRDGTIISGDGTMYTDLGAPRPTTDPVAGARTREQVKAELAEAVRAGTILSGDGTPPSPAVGAVADARIREQVKTELAQALREGTIVSGDGGLPKELVAPQRDVSVALASASCPSDSAQMAHASDSGDTGAAKSYR